MAFIVLAIAPAWIIFGFYLAEPALATRMLGPMRISNPMLELAVHAPAIAAILVVLYSSGPGGLGRFLRRLTLWRCSLGWAAFVLFGIPAVLITAAVAQGTPLPGLVPLRSIPALIMALGFALALGPAEELGWRGVALPVLQRHMTPLMAGIVVGAIWGIWHLPAFYFADTPQHDWGFAAFFFETIALSVILTALFNDTRGSILLPVLFHFQINNPLWPPAQPHDSALFVLVAVFIVWMRRAAMFSRDHAETVVVPD